MSDITIITVAPGSYITENAIKPGLTKTNQKINTLVKKLFALLKTVITFPTRYLGSKSISACGLMKRSLLKIKDLFAEKSSEPEPLLGCGYHRFSHHDMTGDEIKPFIKFSCATAAVHSNNLEWIDPLGFKVKEIKTNLGIEKRDTLFFDHQTGLKFSIFENENQILIPFGALGSSNSVLMDKAQNLDLYRKMFLTAIGNLLGGKTALHLKADEVISKLLKSGELGNKEVFFVGQSLGGSIASFVALRNDQKAICFNSLPLGAGLQQEIGDEKLRHADHYVTHISAKNDYISDSPKILGVIDAIVSFIGLKTPGNFGLKNHIPAAYSKRQEIHDYFLGSMLVHAGFNIHTQPIQLVNEACFAEIK